MITLALLPFVTRQEVFDQVVRLSLLQGKKSGQLNNWGDFNCHYRGPNGTKCNAGQLIGDDEYISKMEGKVWSRMVQDKLAPKRFQLLISRLQDIHDGFEVKDWPTKYRILAKKHRLKYEHNEN